MADGNNKLLGLAAAGAGAAGLIYLLTRLGSLI